MGELFTENSFDGAPGGKAGSSNVAAPYGTPAVNHNPSHFSADKQNTNSGSLSIQPEIDPTKNLEPQVDKIFKKKITPSPDEIISAVKHEMSQMVQKDKNMAKQIVLKNLKADPTHYSRLNMLNIDDEKMKVDENSSFSKFERTKGVLDKMITEKKNQVFPNDKNLNTILKQMWNKRHGYDSTTE